MAYHEKYNEKGFQDLNGLPKELRLKLYEPFNLSYGFEKPVLSRENCCNEEKNTNYSIMPKTLEKVLNNNEKISNPNFRYIYQEDQYRIAIISKYDYKTFFSNDTIKNILKEYSLEEYELNEGNYQKYAIDKFSGYLMSCKKGNCGIEYVYIIQKKDGTSFKRFNSIEIIKLRENNFVVAALTNKKLEYYANFPFDSKKFHFLENYAKSSLFRAGKIGITFCSTPEENYKMYYGDFDINIVGDIMPSHDDDILYGLFLVIPKDQHSSIGLGALDNMEVDKRQVEQYFFNNKYKN
jgi:predicted SAM-dependent methyltransferase